MIFCVNWIMIEKLHLWLLILALSSLLLFFYVSQTGYFLKRYFYLLIHHDLKFVCF